MIAGFRRVGAMPTVIAGQAVLLAALGVVLDRDLWPSDNPVVLVPTFTLLFAWPTLVLFAAESGNFGRTAAFATGGAAVGVLLGTYVGWQATPVGEFNVEMLFAVYVATVLVAGFIALAFVQQFVARAPMGYAALFANAWRNLLVAGLSLALLGGVAVLLALWAALFAILGIDALADTFVEPWFVLPAAGIAFGLGTMLFRRRDALIDGIVGLLESLARYLLPVVLAIVAVFLVTLPFVTVGALWDTGLGSRILIALAAIAVLLIAIAYRPGADLRFPRPVQVAVTAVVAVLPVLSALALMGILIRVGQYGWTVSRCWAVTYAAILALFSLGYLWGVIRYRAEWPRITAPVNVATVCVILAVLLLQNTPVLDFRAISTKSQLARVESSEIEAAEFDFRYAMRELARPGHLVAEELVAELGFDPRQQIPTTAFVAEDGLQIEPSEGWTLHRSDAEPPERDLWAEVSYRPEPFTVPDGAREAIDENPWLVARLANPTLLRVDLDGDPAWEEYLLLGMRRSEFPGWRELPPHVSHHLVAYAIVHADDGWNVVPLSGGGGNNSALGDAEPVLELLRDPPLALLRPHYNHVRIGETIYGFPPGDWSSRPAPDDAP